MRSLTNVNVSARKDPVNENERKRGVGDWLVEYESPNHRDGYVPSEESYVMSRCADFALACVLADALRKVDPDHPLCKCWHLLPENRNNLPKYLVKEHSI